MICQPCKEARHDDCPAAGAQSDLVLIAPLQRIKTAYLSTRTLCDCQHLTGEHINRALIQRGAMRVYLAGPMRGLPDFNFPAFDDAAAKLRELGHEVFNPAERDREVYGCDFAAGTTGDHAEVPQFSIREALASDLDWLARNAEAIVLLDGWQESAGASAERAVAMALDLPIFFLEQAVRWLSR